MERDPTARALTLLSLLQSGVERSGADLADRLEISDRTLRRDATAAGSSQPPRTFDRVDYEAARTGLLHHVELWVLDLSAARPRWQWLLGSLGYEQFQSWDNGVSYRLGPTYIVLEQPPALIEGSHERRRPGADGSTLNFEYEAGMSRRYGRQSRVSSSYRRTSTSPLTTPRKPRRGRCRPARHLPSSNLKTMSESCSTRLAIRSAYSLQGEPDRRRFPAHTEAYGVSWPRGAASGLGLRPSSKVRSSKVTSTGWP